MKFHQTKKPHCHSCGSKHVIVGGTNGSLYFDPGHHKRSWLDPLSSKQGVRVHRNMDCCIECGLSRTGLDGEDLRRFLIKRCEDEYVKRIYQPNETTNSNNTDVCLRCGAKKRIPGKLFKSDDDGNGISYSVQFKPKRLKWFRLITKFVGLKHLCECCADCGFVFTHVDLAELNRFILKNCKPEYVRQLYSYYE